MTKRKNRIFTLQEADGLIPELEKRLKLLRAKKESYSRTHDLLFMHELVCAAERTHGFQGEEESLERGIHALEEAIEELARDIEAVLGLGCFLRNIEAGHIEFPAIHNGEQVYLSWQIGEPCVSYYRPRGKKFHERESLSKKSQARKTK